MLAEAAPLAPAATIRLSEVLSALSYALDITEGQPPGHAARSGLVAMRLAAELRLPNADRAALFYGALLKDAGCSSNAAKVCALFDADDRTVKRDLKNVEWTRKTAALGYLARNAAPGQSPWRRTVRIAKLALDQQAGKQLIQTRCSRGADIARQLGFGPATADAVRALDEHWDGRGEPLGLRGAAIPLLGRILCLAQTVEVFFAAGGRTAALQVARERSGAWFDPDLVQALAACRGDAAFWQRLADPEPRAALARFEPEELRLDADEDRLDAAADGFASIVDAKSPWTFRHSHGVAAAAVGMFEVLGYDAPAIRHWRRAALLHDIGKLGVSNTILDKPGRLSDDEMAAMRSHVDHTRRILRLVPGFRAFADVAAAHHEKLDGSGYSLGLTADRLSMEARVLAVADIYDALSAERPYRPGKMPREQVLEIIAKEAGAKLCPEACAALETHLRSVPA